MAPKPKKLDASTLPIEDQDINSNWTKSTLDLYYRDRNGKERLVKNKKDLLQWLDQSEVNLAEFKETPTYRNAVDSGNYPWLEDI